MSCCSPGRLSSSHPCQSSEEKEMQPKWSLGLAAPGAPRAMVAPCLVTGGRAAQSDGNVPGGRDRFAILGLGQRAGD
jgi:hypothetical protein